jgi:signal transduction histidine kinase
MKLTTKLSLAVSIGIMLVLSAHAAMRVRRDVERFHEDVRSDHRVLGRSLAAAVELLSAEEGPARARALVSEVNRREHDVTIRWVDVVSDVPVAEDRTTDIMPPRVPGLLSSTLTTIDGEPALVTYATLQTPGEAPTAIELVEPLANEPEYVREAIVRTASTTALVCAICIAIILGFGVLFVGRPLAALREHAQRVARGELGTRTAVRAEDEVAELARDMNRMSEELGRAREKARDEGAARMEALAQLRHADRLRAVGEMASAVAHDLGTPLGTVRARAQMIAGGEADAGRSRELAANVVDEVDRMSAAIRQLLDHARREPGQRETVELRAWAAALLDVLRPLAERRDVRLELAPGDPAEAEIDPSQMRQVLTNLVMNAIDASPAGGVVEIELGADESSVRLAVRDRGEGVPPELVERVFEPFFTTKRGGEGTGLGLSIARGIARDHGGDIRVESGRGPGTTFVVTLASSSR